MRARRLRIIDEVVDGEESVVLVGDTVVWLSPLATAILAELDDWTESAALAEAMAEIFGPPPEGTDGMASIETALRDMTEQGLVEYV